MTDKQSVSRSPLSLVTLLLSVVLLAVALMRWRDNGWSSLVWLTAFVITFSVRAPFVLRNRSNIVVASRSDPKEKALLGAMFLTMMALPLLHLATHVFAFADYQLPDWVTWIGAIAQLPFLWLFWRSHADLDRNWSPSLEVRKDHALVTTGIYAWMRHPMYAAIWIAALSQPLLIHNWIAGALVVPACAALWFLRVPNEEAMMRETFGATYSEYAKAVGRLLPRL
ncbi:protein-S-isoprenylcysteine O-methyltransferase (plasmid) [Nitrobacteraceae bacterium UC4446_H13]